MKYVWGKMKIKSLAISSLSLTFVFASLFPISAQATDGCDIFANSSCQWELDDGYARLTGKLFDLSPSVTLSNPQSVVEFRLVAPSAAERSARNFDKQTTSVYCSVDDATRISVAHSTDQGVSSEVLFQGQSQTVTSSITPHGEHSLVVISFLVPQTAALAPYSCSASINNLVGGTAMSGDGYSFTLNLNRTFTPSTPTPTPTPSASTRSTPTPTASASPRATSSPSPSASAEATNEEDEVEARSSEVVVLGNTESQNEASPMGFFLAGTLSALAGVGATVAFIQRKAIIEAFAKLKKIAKP
jgi:hypothetical protein